MRFRHVPVAIPALVTLLSITACRVGSPGGTMTSGDVVITATIERLGESDQFKTDLMIEQLLADGTTESIAAPSVISQAGERAEVRIEEDDRRLIATIDVPGPDAWHETVRVQVTIEEPGSLRSPRMLLPIPPAGTAPGGDGRSPEPGSDPADTARPPG